MLRVDGDNDNNCFQARDGTKYDLVKRHSLVVVGGVVLATHHHTRAFTCV